MTTAAAEPIVKTQEKTTSSDSTFELLKGNYENALNEKNGGSTPAASQEQADVDVTASFQEKFNPLQKDGKIEDINKLREEVQAAVASGKKVSADFLSQLELAGETPEQKQIRELTAKTEAITNDLKLSEKEKTEALQALEVKKPKNFWEEPDYDNTPAAKEKNEDKDGALKILELKAKQLEEIEADPFLASYLSAKKSGKDTGTFLSEIGKDNPSTLTDEQVLESSIKRSGLNDEEAIEQRDHFKTMDPISRKSLLGKERAILNQDYQKNFDKYSNNNAAESERALSVAKQTIKETQDYLSNIQGKEVRGIVYDSTQVQKLGEWAKNIMENGLFREDGSHDVPTIMQLGMLKLNSQHMLQKAFEKGEYATNEKWYAQYGRPSKDNGISRTPDAAIVGNTQAEAEKNNAEWRKKNNFSEVVQKQS